MADLFEAVKAHDVAAVERLIQSKADVNETRTVRVCRRRPLCRAIA